jgi:hypothetical protein
VSTTPGPQTGGPQATGSQPIGPETGRKDLGPLRNLPRSAVVSFMQKAAVETGHRTKIAAFLPRALWGWIKGYLGSRLGKKHKFLTYAQGKENGIYPLDDQSVIGGTADPNGEIRVGLVGDWGTGTDEANAVADRMMKLDPHFTIHLGDVYYVGSEDEMEENCLGKSPKNEKDVIPCTWPVGSVGSFAMNGNHEMYALGDAYFDSFFKVLGIRPALGGDPLTQKASYFCLQNDFWQIIALDTGYHSVGVPILEEIFQPDCHLEPANLNFVQNLVSPKGKSQGLFILSHHQYYSAFQKNFPKPAQQLQDLIDRPVLWFWGHEHRMTVYGLGSVKNSIKAFGRCIGHGGMPVDINEPVTPGTPFPALVYDHRPYSPPGENITVGMNGFAMLTFKGNQLQVDYYDWTAGQGPLLTENWKVENAQLQGISINRGDTNFPEGHQLTVGPNLNRAIGK